MEVPRDSADKSRRRACDPCRKRKVKCSRNDPLCGRCTQLGLRCEYSPNKPMGRPRSTRPGFRILQENDDGFNLPAAASVTEIAVSPLAADFMDMESFPVSIRDDFSGFNAPLPLPGIDFDQHQGGPEAGPSSCIPCMLHHGLNIESETGLANEPATTRAAKKCSCVELVNQHFSLLEDSAESFQTIKALQQSTKSAESILECDVCFGPVCQTLGTSRNINLLGSLMSSIISTYGAFFLHQKRRAEQCSHGGEPLKLLIGQPPDPANTVELSLDGQSYSNMIRASIGIELKKLLELMHAFAERQTRLHNNGHEECQKEASCQNMSDLLEGRQSEEEVCPQKVDITKMFACFRTVDQVRAVMEETQKILMS
ncbi:unnamed protein product [Clonostachys solani]|uniref:Zn(2)-C6 fungal-type domain-containing protein n=1 Tax=Clonostachys solani TaxID=160281 RepID=A0A9N9YYP0_9HYPO|nr:unnamed protein product [Clonostachys solani]